MFFDVMQTKKFSFNFETADMVKLPINKSSCVEHPSIYVKTVQ